MTQLLVVMEIGGSAKHGSRPNLVARKRLRALGRKFLRPSRTSASPALRASKQAAIGAATSPVTSMTSLSRPLMVRMQPQQRMTSNRHLPTMEAGTVAVVGAVETVRPTLLPAEAEV